MNTYNRNGTFGVGFVIQHGGRWQHSIAWPDGPGERFTDRELRHLGIACDYAGGLVPDTYEANQAEQAAAAALEEAIEAKQEEIAADATTEASDEVTEVAEPTEPEHWDGSAKFTPNLDDSEAANIRAYLAAFPIAATKTVIADLASAGINVTHSQVSRGRKSIG